jgi:hypothetical protein
MTCACSSLYIKFNAFDTFKLTKTLAVLFVAIVQSRCCHSSIHHHYITASKKRRLLAVEPPDRMHLKAEKHMARKLERAQQNAYFRCRLTHVLQSHGYSCVLALVSTMHWDLINAVSNLLTLHDENYACIDGSIE